MNRVLKDEPAEGQRKGRRMQGIGDRDGYRQISETLQAGFAAEVQSLLVPAQLEAFGALSSSARSFQSLEMVSAAGEGERRLEAMWGQAGSGFGGPRGRGGGADMGSRRGR